MFQAAHEELAIAHLFKPALRTDATTLYNLDTAIGDAVGIDMTGYDEALIVIKAGVIGAGQTLDFTAWTAAANDAEAASFAIVEGTDGVDNAAQFLNTHDGLIKLIRIKCADVERYLFLKVVITGSDDFYFDASVILCKAKKVPVTQPAGTSVSFTHGS